MYQLIIVEDDEITKDALSDYIKKMCPRFYVCRTFSNGEQALEYIREHPVHMVLTDIKMPKMDGLSLCHEIHKINPLCQMIIISGYGTFQYARQALQYGVKNYLLKPIDFKEVKNCLETAANSLDSQKVSVNTSEEDIALFFTNVVFGNLNSPIQINDYVQKLNLPISPGKHPGKLLRLALSQHEDAIHWQYEKDRLPYAFTNVIRMSVTDTYVCNFLITGAYFYFLLIFQGEEQTIDSHYLTATVMDLFHIKCQLEEIAVFPNLYTLSSLNVLKKAGIHQNRDTKNKSRDDNAIIETVKQYINDNYDKDISREDVANVVYFSPAYFSRFFKEKTGLNFIDYLTSVRMEKAIQLLGTNLTIGEISRRVGYKSQNRFILNFRQHTSITPSEYRKLFY